MSFGSNNYDPIYSFLLKNIVDKYHYNMNNIIVNGVWKIDLFYNPDPKERTFRYTIIVSQTSNGGQGASYCSHDEHISANKIGCLIGAKISNILFDKNIPYCLKISVLDALYQQFRPIPDYSVLIEGSSKEKAYYRAEIVTNEIITLLYRRIRENKVKNKEAIILNIGFVSLFYEILRKKIYSIKFLATDLYKDILDKIINNIKILDGRRYNKELLKKSDIAIVTGMALSTSSLYNILKYAKEYDTNVVIFAETGYNLSPHYITFGADIVVSEEFPYYIFNGVSRISIYRKH